MHCVCLCVHTRMCVCMCVYEHGGAPRELQHGLSLPRDLPASVWLATNQQYLCPMSPPLSHEPGSHPLHSMPQRKKLEIWQINKFIVKKQNNVAFDTEKDIKGLSMFKKAFVRMSLFSGAAASLHKTQAVSPGGRGPHILAPGHSHCHFYLTKAQTPKFLSIGQSVGTYPSHKPWPGPSAW